MGNEELEEQFKKHIAMMMSVAAMCQNAPKDQSGNVVVDIVGIKDLGLFYIYKN